MSLYTLLTFLSVIHNLEIYLREELRYMDHPHTFTRSLMTHLLNYLFGFWVISHTPYMLLSQLYSRRNDPTHPVWSMKSQKFTSILQTRHICTMKGRPLLEFLIYSRMDILMHTLLNITLFFHWGMPELWRKPQRKIFTFNQTSYKIWYTKHQQQESKSHYEMRFLE